MVGFSQWCASGSGRQGPAGAAAGHSISFLCSMTPCNTAFGFTTVRGNAYQEQLIDPSAQWDSYKSMLMVSILPTALKRDEQPQGQCGSLLELKFSEDRS